MNWFAAPAVASAAYFSLALIAAIRHSYRHQLGSYSYTPPISILKAVRGRDLLFYEALVSHAAQAYPEFEIVFGVKDPEDPALIDIKRLMVEYPHIPMRLITSSPATRNGKVGTLIALAEAARFPTLLVNDSDIQVDPDYLRRVVAPLESSDVGMVTCLYRASGQSAATRFEALGIATEFMPSVLVARLIGIAEFALGSTMVFRAKHLQAIGGFAAISDYLADDYQLGTRIHGLGLKIVFADSIVETNLGAGSWSSAWNHQLRWARTIRVSRTGGYIGSIITHGTFWSVVAAFAGEWKIAVICLVLRMIAGCVTAHVLRASIAWWLIPFRDLWGSGVWFVSILGSTVEWRGQKLNLRRDGRIEVTK